MSAGRALPREAYVGQDFYSSSPKRARATSGDFPAGAENSRGSLL